MTLKSEIKVCETSRMEVGCATMTVENENKVCGRMYKKSRLELGYAKMTVES